VSFSLRRRRLSITTLLPPLRCLLAAAADGEPLLDPASGEVE
jgi:hypothetical protein